MHTKALEKVVHTILQYVSSEQEVTEIIESLLQVDWRSQLNESGFIACEGCGYVYRIGIHPSTWVCPRCDPYKQRECARLAYATQSEIKTPKTLTIEHWLTTLDYFKWKCAYCQERQYEHIEHFIPRFLNGKTTVNNCVPCCRPCNNKKHCLHPDNVKLLPKEAMERVRVYLKQF